jgi:hypothetical protein
MRNPRTEKVPNSKLDWNSRDTPPPPTAYLHSSRTKGNG